MGEKVVFSLNTGDGRVRSILMYAYMLYEQ